MKELIKKAKEIGFEGMLYGMWDNSIKSDSDDYMFFLWMCELQKWLRDEHEIVISINLISYEGIYYFEYFIESFGSSPRYIHKSDFKTYEKALKYALIEALKLIK